MRHVADRSYWSAVSGEASERYPRLRANLNTEVAIIGAGITGLTAAMHLKLAGMRVVVLEAGRVGSGTTGASTGYLEPLPDQGTRTLVGKFGEGDARQVTVARLEAIDRIVRWRDEYDIACDLRRVPTLLYAEEETGLEELYREYDTVRRLGVAVSMVRETGLPFATAGAIRVDGMARINPLKYVRGLAREIHGGGSAIFEHTRAGVPEIGEHCRVQTPEATVSSSVVIMATHSAYLGVSQFDMRQEPWLSYVLALRVAERLPDALFLDTADPYHYLRLAASNDPRLVIVGGADHRVAQGDERRSVEQLEAYARERLTVEAVEHRWSAELFEPADGLPLAGQAPLRKNLFIATGFSGTGLTMGTMAGTLIAELVLGRKPALAKVLSPSRVKPLAAGAKVVSENVSVARHLIAGRFSGEPVATLDEIGRGEGRLVKYQGQSLAVYRGEAGELYLLSPKCTHAGCYVHWNGFEKTWDCPCHGGRYDAMGARIYGPPPADLEGSPTREVDHHVVEDTDEES